MVYNQAAKAELAAEEAAEIDPELLDQLEAATVEFRQSRHLHRAVDDAYAQEVEAKIRQLQSEKQAIMAELKEHLRQLDQSGKQQIGRSSGFPTRYMDGQLLASVDNGQHWQSVTVGELVTDAEWGVDYNINAAKIPRSVCKKYLYEKAKMQIQSLLNEQILHDELADRFIDSGKERAYSALLAERRKIPQFGHVVEVMIKNYLTKLGYDHNMDLTVELGDVHQDVEHKIDFIIRRTGHTRGVEVNQNSEIESLAVQLTINTQDEVLAHKRDQVARSKRNLQQRGQVDDIALVSVGSSVSAEMLQQYNVWLRDGKQPGGPDRELSLATKEALFRQLLQRMYSDEELDERWRQIAGYETNPEGQL